MALGSCAQWSSCNNLPANPIREQDKLASPQSLVNRSETSSNEAPIPQDALILPFVPPTKDFFTQFIRSFVEST